MVDALCRVHPVLHHDGFLLDLHPTVDNDIIEVWRDGEVLRMGEVDQSIDPSVEMADAALARVEREHMFEPTGRTLFEMLGHYPGVDDWLTHWNDEGYTFDVAENVLEATRSELGDGRSELVIREPIVATRLERL